MMGEKRDLRLAQQYW